MSLPAIKGANAGRQLMLTPAIFLDLAVDADGDHGEVFTRKWVVDLILDLVGYTADRDLAGLTFAHLSAAITGRAAFIRALR